MSGYTIKIVENDEGSNKTDDPLDRVFHTDEASVGWPEDLTCDRNLGEWIDEVNRLREQVVELGGTLSGGDK